ncbi:hypothetical protein L195_g051122, partial [Trifolium pratense]
MMVLYGVPIHAWNDNFFSLLAKQYGIYLNADDTTSKKLSMDVARILIRTPGLKAVDDFISVKVDDELFQIRLIEDSHGPMRIAVPLTGSKEGRDDDSSSSEDEEGDFPVMEVEEEVVEREGDVEGQQLLALTNFINDNNSLPNGFGIASPGRGGNSRSVEKAELGQKPKAISSKGGSKGGSKVCVDNLCRRPKPFIPSESIKGGKEYQTGGGIRSGIQKEVAGSTAGSIPISSKNNAASTIVPTGSRRSNCDQIIP